MCWQIMYASIVQEHPSKIGRSQNSVEARLECAVLCSLEKFSYLFSVSLPSATKNTRCGHPGRRAGLPCCHELRLEGGDIPTAMCGPLAGSIKQTSRRTGGVNERRCEDRNATRERFRLTARRGRAMSCGADCRQFVAPSVF